MSRSRSADRGFRRMVESSTSVFGPPLAVVLRMAIAETLGTAMLVFLGCMGVATGLPETPRPLLLIGFGFGLAVMLIILIIGHISKAHINPAVTVGLVIFGDLGIPLAAVYFMAQCIGATMGFGTLMSLLPYQLDGNLTKYDICVTQPAPQITPWQAMLTEFLLTAILVLVVCGVFDWRNATKHDSVPIKFGLTIAGLAILGAPFSGASMNPARSLAPALWSSNWRHHWVYWIGPLGGSIVASTFYRFMFMIPQPESDTLNNVVSDQSLPLRPVDSVKSNDDEK